MEVQERAHNATALLALVLRRLNPNDAALVSATQPQNDTQLIEHEQSNGLEKPEDEAMNGEKSEAGFSGGLIEDLVDLFNGELKPVAPKAQKKVPMPPDLDLGHWTSRERWSSDSSSSEDEGSAAVFTAPQPEPRPLQQLTHEELQMLREARRVEQANNPHYLKDDSPRSYQQEDVPVAEIALEVPLQIHTKRSDKYLRESSKKTKKEKRPTKKRKNKKVVHSTDESESDDEASLRARPAVEEGGELPEGAALSDEESAPQPDDPHRALDLDLDQPLREEELLTSRIHQYPSPESGLVLTNSIKKSSKKTKTADETGGEKTKTKKKKEKKSKHNKVDLILPELGKDDGDLFIAKDNDVSEADKRAKESGAEGDHITSSKTEKHKKKKESKDKDSKKKKASKKDKHGSKTGYEEALGISTPSKEVI
ncbi:AP-3 complex subunit delta-1 domain-containing protein [Phthorimaea operculella]|nr:AP-3 complex subunit delta-1 domain-containing protein [Phthorimaea operculella]